MSIRVDRSVPADVRLGESGALDVGLCARRRGRHHRHRPGGRHPSGTGPADQRHRLRRRRRDAEELWRRPVGLLSADAVPDGRRLPRFRRRRRRVLGRPFRLLRRPGGARLRLQVVRSVLERCPTLTIHPSRLAKVNFFLLLLCPDTNREPILPNLL